VPAQGDRRDYLAGKHPSFAGSVRAEAIRIASR
jgi:hypothetical protein